MWPKTGPVLARKSQGLRKNSIAHAYCDLDQVCKPPFRSHELMSRLGSHFLMFTQIEQCEADCIEWCFWQPLATPNLSAAQANLHANLQVRALNCHLSSSLLRSELLKADLVWLGREEDSLGDTSTLADPSVVEVLLSFRDK